MHGRVHVAPFQLGRRSESEHSGGGRIGENAPSVGGHPVDALVGGFQEQPGLLLALAKALPGPSQVFLHGLHGREHLGVLVPAGDPDRGGEVAVADPLGNGRGGGDRPPDGSVHQPDEQQGGAGHDTAHQEQNPGLDVSGGVFDLHQDAVLVRQGGRDHLVDQVRGLAVDAADPQVDGQRRVCVCRPIQLEGGTVLRTQLYVSTQELRRGGPVPPRSRPTARAGGR